MYASTDMKMRPGEFREIGQTLGPDITARQIPPIGMAMDQLEKELHSLREVIHLLEQKLSPALRPVPESMSKESIEAHGGSPLASQLEVYCRLARLANADVRGLIDCLEL